MTPEQDQTNTDEKACAERLDYWLKKYDCILEGTAIIKNGYTEIRIGIVKLTPEQKKMIKEAEKRGQSALPAFQG